MSTGSLDELQAEALSTIAQRLQGLAGALNSTREVIDVRALELNAQSMESSKVHAKQQSAVIWLSVVIAASTLVYTCITGWSVTVMRESNAIQCAVALHGEDAASQPMVATACSRWPTKHKETR